MSCLIPSVLRRSVRGKLIAAFLGVAAQGSRDIAQGAEAVAGSSTTGAERIARSRQIADQLAARAADLEDRVGHFTV